MADSIRDALTSAFAEHTSDDKAAAATTPEPAQTAGDVTLTTAPASEPKSTASAADGGTAPDTKPAGGDNKSAAATAPATKTDPSQGRPTTAQQPPPADPAPGSWKAAEKETWAQIPAAAREAIKRREAEMQRVVGMSTEARRHHEAYSQVMHVFQPLLDAKGIRDPLNQVIKPVLQIRAALEIGSPEQKARIVADMVRDFKIDIETLDRALTQPGSPPPPNAPAFDPRALPELAPLFQLSEQIAARTHARAAEAIQSVESLPHYEDLRNDMADIMERLAHKGVTISTQEAYNRAMALNGLAPTTPSAPTGTVTPSEAAAILARSRKAATSISGAPQTGVGAKKPATLRDQIAHAMESSG